MLRPHRFSPPAIRTLLLVAAAAGLLAGCGPTPSRQRHGLQASLRVERTCRRILADLPAGVSVEEARKAYGHCLRVMHEEEGSGEAALPAAGQGPQAAPPPPSPAPPAAVTEQERYVYCRLHSEAIRAAAERYNRALMAYGSTQVAPGSQAHALAEQERAEALEALADAIPERFRLGRPLVPDSLREFQRCRFSS